MTFEDNAGKPFLSRYETMSPVSRNAEKLRLLARGSGYVPLKKEIRVDELYRRFERKSPRSRKNAHDASAEEPGSLLSQKNETVIPKYCSAAL